MPEPFVPLTGVVLAAESEPLAPRVVEAHEPGQRAVVPERVVQHRGAALGRVLVAVVQREQEALERGRAVPLEHERAVREACVHAARVPRDALADAHLVNPHARAAAAVRHVAENVVAVRAARRATRAGPVLGRARPAALARARAAGRAQREERKRRARGAARLARVARRLRAAAERSALRQFEADDHDAAASRAAPAVVLRAPAAAAPGVRAAVAPRAPQQGARLPAPRGLPVVEAARAGRPARPAVLFP